MFPKRVYQTSILLASRNQVQLMFHHHSYREIDRHRISRKCIWTFSSMQGRCKDCWRPRQIMPVVPEPKDHFWGCEVDGKGPGALNLSCKPPWPSSQTISLRGMQGTRSEVFPLCMPHGGSERPTKAGH